MKLNKKIISVIMSFLFGIGLLYGDINEHQFVYATILDNEYYPLLATAIDASKTNTFEDNKNPQMFDANNPLFINAISARKDVDTYASSIEASSAYDFSQKYAKEFSSELDTSISVYGVTTDVSGKFEKNVDTKTYKQKIEKYEYYYWLAQKYVVNIDWKDSSILESLSSPFKRELENINSVTSAKQLLRTYGSHVYSTYVLGGKLEITKYFTQDASYELSDTEKKASASLNVIIDQAKVDAKVSGSVNLSTYESSESSSSNYYSKLSYHAYGGDTNGAAKASDLFQYKTQFGTGTASGFLYEAWTNSFNNNNVALKIVSAKNAVAIWNILDSNKYSSQITYLKKAFDNMCYESYSEKCNEFEIPCDYIESLTYVSNGTLISINPHTTNINLPENTTININLSDLITNKFDSSEYLLELSSDNVASLNNNTLNIKSGTIGRTFDIELLINNILAYKLGVTIKKEAYSGGYGTEQQPYLLSTRADLLSLFADLSSSNNYYQLTNNISFEGEKINVGGAGTSSPFTGTFDGNGFKISDFTIKASSFNNEFPYVGLFGKNEGTIKNLILDNVICLTNGLVKINNSNVTLSCGILAGYNSGIVSNCQIKNSSIRISTTINNDTSILNVGGVAGYSDGLVEYTAVNGCSIYGMVTKGKGTINIGGITGILSGAKISESYVCNSQINDYNGDTSSFTMGGIVGHMIPKQEDTILIKPKLSMCLVYNIKNNKNGDTFGYIAGTESNGEFTNCYYTAIKELSVAGSSMSNCTRKDDIKLSTLPSVFYDNWVAGQGGPILKMHQ